MRDEYGYVSDPIAPGSSGRRQREVRLCVGDHPPTRGPGRGGPSRVRRLQPAGGGGRRLSSLIDSDFWTIERLTALAGLVFLSVNLLVLSVWLPHPHVHLPHLHMPHLPHLPRRRTRPLDGPNGTLAPGVPVGWASVDGPSNASLGAVLDDIAEQRASPRRPLSGAGGVEARPDGRPDDGGPDSATAAVRGETGS